MHGLCYACRNTYKCFQKDDMDAIDKALSMEMSEVFGGSLVKSR